MNKTILAIGAHYDDIEIGIGGTLRKHVENSDNIHIAVLDSNEHRTGDTDIRLIEQFEALSLLGIDSSALKLFNTDDSISEIVSILDKINADIIYTMFELDTHQAHRRSSYVGQSVGRRLSTQLIFYNSGSSYNFSPNLFSIINFEFKQKVLKCFKSQIKVRAVNINAIERREAYWASLITEKPVYAEGLVIRKMIYEV